ncbi:MAG TPA: hypothetical protein VGE24_10300, partial [Emticicia sp.]
MDLKLFKKHLFLILSIVFTITAALNFFIFEKDAPRASQEHYVNAIRARIRTEIVQSKDELFSIGTQYQKATESTFLNFEAVTVYPYYIFM